MANRSARIPALATLARCFTTYLHLSHHHSNSTSSIHPSIRTHAFTHQHENIFNQPKGKVKFFYLATEQVWLGNLPPVCSSWSTLHCPPCPSLPVLLTSGHSRRRPPTNNHNLWTTFLPWQDMDQLAQNSCHPVGRMIVSPIIVLAQLPYSLLQPLSAPPPPPPPASEDRRESEPGGTRQARLWRTTCLQQGRYK